MNLISASKLLFLAASIHCYYYVNGQDNGCSFQGNDTVDINGDGSLIMRQFIDGDSETVTVQLEYKGEEGWIGFAFSEQPIMVPNIAVIGIPATNTVLKYSLQARSPDSVLELEESRQTLTDTSIVVEDGKTILTFTKPLIEENEQEIFRNEENNFIYAIGFSNDFPIIHAERGLGSAQFIQCSGTVAPVAAPTKSPANGGAGRIDLGNGRIQFTLDDLEDGNLSVILITDENAGTITVDMIHANGVGWIGFAFSNDEFMTGSVAGIAIPDDGTGTIQKYDLSARVLPTIAPMDRQTLVDATYFHNETHTGMKFTKLLQEEGEPMVTVDQNNFFLYAIGNENSLSYHRTRASFQLNFADDNTDIAPVGTNKPSLSPSDMVIVPTAKPSSSPSDVVVTPTVKPSPGPSEVVVTPVPSHRLTDVAGTPTASPTITSLSFSKTPSISPRTFVSETFIDVFIDFVGVKQMSVTDTRRFEVVSEDWYNKFFASRSFDLGVQEMIAYITVTNQTMTARGNTVNYDQTITYYAVDDHVDPEQYLDFPFLDRMANTEYGRTLSETLEPFADLVLPVGIPRITKNIILDDNNPKQDSESSSNIALIGGVVGAVAFILLIAGVGSFILFKRRTNVSQQTTKTSNNAITSNADQVQVPVHERRNIKALNTPGFQHQGQYVTPTRHSENDRNYTAAVNEPEGVLLGEDLPEYKDQVRSKSIAIAKAIPFDP